MCGISLCTRGAPPTWSRGRSTAALAATMDVWHDFLNWAWERHQNPLSWYIRPLFILPFCYFAYRKGAWGMVLTIVAVASSMFWFPAPELGSSTGAAFLAMERQYLAAPWGIGKTAMAALIPIWFIALAGAFWLRSWIAGFLVINVGAALKIVWSFYFGGEAAWSTIPPVAIGLVVCNGFLVYMYHRMSSRAANNALERTRYG